MPRDCPDCTSSAFDYFAFTVHPIDSGWNQRAGGAGRLRDPVDPGRQSVPSLRTYAGPNATPGLASTEGSLSTQPVVIPVNQGRSQVLSVALDMATGPQADQQFAWRGTFSRTHLIPFIGHRPQPALVLERQASPVDPDGGAQLHASASIDATQPGGIWGASAASPRRGATGPSSAVELRSDDALQIWNVRDGGHTPAMADATGSSLLRPALLGAGRRPRKRPSTTLPSRGGL